MFGFVESPFNLASHLSPLPIGLPHLDYSKISITGNSNDNNFITDTHVKVRDKNNILIFRTKTTLGLDSVSWHLIVRM